MSSKITSPAGDKDDRKEAARKARLAQELRANLQRRKAQARSRRTGEADDRPDGLACDDAGTRGDEDSQGGT